MLAISLSLTYLLSLSHTHTHTSQVEVPCLLTPYPMAGALQEGTEFLKKSVPSIVLCSDLRELDDRSDPHSGHDAHSTAKPTCGLVHRLRHL